MSKKITAKMKVLNYFNTFPKKEGYSCFYFNVV